MFKRFGEAAMQVMHAAAADSERFSSPVVGTQHLLLGLTRSSDCLAARALESMGVNVKSVSSELQQINAPVEAASTGLDPRSSFIEYEVQPVYSDLAQEALGRAKDHCRYFGEVELKPEHILLAVVDVDKSGAVKILEELGANLSFLRRHVITGGDPVHTFGREVAADGILDHRVDRLTAIGKRRSGAAAGVHKAESRCVNRAAVHPGWSGTAAGDHQRGQVEGVQE